MKILHKYANNKGEVIFATSPQIAVNYFDKDEGTTTFIKIGTPSFTEKRLREIRDGDDAIYCHERYGIYRYKKQEGEKC